MTKKLISDMSLSELIQELEMLRTTIEFNLHRQGCIDIKWEILNLLDRIEGYQKVCDKVEKISKRIRQLESEK